MFYTQEKSFPLNFSIVIVFILGITLNSCGDSNIDSVEKAKEYAVGTWMGCQDMADGKLNCQKFVINEDDSFIQYSTPGSVDTWGDPLRSGKWSVGTDKFSDTGELYYYIEFNSTGFSKRYPIYKGQLLMDYKSASEPGPYLSKEL